MDGEEVGCADELDFAQRSFKGWCGLSVAVHVLLCVLDRAASHI